MGRIIAFSNQKGGVGKTTTCVNMAAYVAAAGKRVLLVDMDPQGNATTGLGFEKSSIKKSVYNVLINDESADKNTLKTEVENLDLLPSNIALAGAEVELVLKKDREHVFKRALDKISDLYDYVFIDCPPSLGLITVNALVAANAVIIPIQCEFYAMEGLTQLLHTIQLVKKHFNSSLQIAGVVLTMYDSRALVSRQIAEDIRGFFKNKLFEIVIPRNIRLSEAPSHGKPIILHDPKCNGARAYKALAEEFLKREGGND